MTESQPFARSSAQVRSDVTRPGLPRAASLASRTARGAMGGALGGVLSVGVVYVCLWGNVGEDADTVHRLILFSFVTGAVLGAVAGLVAYGLARCGLPGVGPAIFLGLIMYGVPGLLWVTYSMADHLFARQPLWPPAAQPLLGLFCGALVGFGAGLASGWKTHR